MVIIVFFLFLTSYFNNGQYAVAINVPQWQCQSGFFPETNNFLTHDPSATVKPFTQRDSMNVYRNRQLIAAGFRNDAHSEYLLMYPEFGSTMPNSPLTDLLNHNSNGCVIFYTLNSPCIARCLNDNIRPRRDIIPGLGQLNAYQGIKAFVFTHVYRPDLNNNNLRNELQKIADRVPLYRCNNGCILCGRPGSNIPVIDECLN